MIRIRYKSNRVLKFALSGQMSDTYYGLLAFISLIGLFISLSGPLGNIVGLAIIGICNGLAVSMACKQKYKRKPAAEQELTET